MEIIANFPSLTHSLYPRKSFDPENSRDVGIFRFSDSQKFRTGSDIRISGLGVGFGKFGAGLGFKFQKFWIRDSFEKLWIRDRVDLKKIWDRDLGVTLKNSGF